MHLRVMSAQYCLYSINILLNNFLFLYCSAGSCCCVGFSLVAESRGYSLVAMPGILIVVVSLVVELRLWGMQASLVAVGGLSSCGFEPWSTGLIGYTGSVAP